LNPPHPQDQHARSVEYQRFAPVDQEMVRRAGEAAQFAKKRNPTAQTHRTTQTLVAALLKPTTTRKINTRQPSNINASRLLITRG
jgi:hypothetical protein